MSRIKDENRYAMSLSAGELRNLGEYRYIKANRNSLLINLGVVLVWSVCSMTFATRYDNWVQDVLIIFGMLPLAVLYVYMQYNMNKSGKKLYDDIKKVNQ